MLFLVLGATAAAAGPTPGPPASAAPEPADAGVIVPEPDAGATQPTILETILQGEAPEPPPPEPPPPEPPPPEPPEAPTPISEGIVVVVADEPTPLVFHLASGRRDPRRRATDAGLALRYALELAPVDEAAQARAQVIVHDGVASVRVKGRTIARLSEADAHAAGYLSIELFSEQLETRLLHFVLEHERRGSLRALAFHIFFSVALVLLGLLTLRGFNRAFLRADAAVNDRQLRPLVVVGVPVLSSDAVRGLLASALVLGRGLAFVTVVAVVVAAILAQFERTRPLLQRLVASVARPMFSGIEALAAAIPGLLLALVLLIVLRGGLRFLRLLLDGVAAGRVQSAWIAPAQAAVARSVLSVIVVVIALPLIVGAAFGRFGTPFEVLALGLGGVGLLAAVPVLASALVGAVTMWRGRLRVGEWVEIGTTRGEVSSVSLTAVVLVPESDGSVIVPMLALVVRPLRRLPAAPRIEHVVRLRREEKTRALLDKLTAITRTVDDGGTATLLDADDESVTVCLQVSRGPSTGVAELVGAVLDAVDDGVLTLAPGPRSR